MEGPLSGFGNLGPNVSKKLISNKFPFHVGQMALCTSVSSWQTADCRKKHFSTNINFTADTAEFKNR